QTCALPIYGNARVGKDVLEHRPAAVVEAPGLIGGDCERREESLNARGELGISGCRIAHLVELAREAAEVVKGAGRCHRRHGRERHVPVGRDREHRARAGEGRADRRPGARPGVLVQRIHRVAVAEITSCWSASATPFGSRSKGTVTTSSSHSHWPEVEKLK